MRLSYSFCSGFTAIILFFTPASSVAQLFFRSEALSASVIDAETAEPISDAVVIAYWKLEKPRFFHGHDYKILERIETKTDRNGKFSLEAWGPKFVIPSWRMSGDSPYVYILKSGYKLEIISNYSTAFGGFACPGSQFAETTRGIPTHVNSLIVASWNACRIKLERPTEMPDEYAMRLSLIRSTLCDREEGTQCGKDLVEYFEAEKQRFFSSGAKRIYW